VADRDRSVNILINAKNQASAALEKIGLSLGGVAAAAAAAGAALTAMAVVMSKAIAAASEQEKADVKLALALKSIGQNTDETREDLAGFIDRLEDLTKVNDETISSVISLLAQFGQLSGQALQDATRATLDYAAATGQEATAAATALVNVIVKGQGRLAGINTKFEEGSTAAERLAKVMDQLRKVEGDAEAQGKTFEGAVAQLGIEWERLLEILGSAVVENAAVREAIASLAAVIKVLAGFISENKDAIGGLVTVIAEVAKAAIDAVPKLVKFVNLVAFLSPGVGALKTIFASTGALLKDVDTQFQAAADSVKTGTGAFEGATDALSPLDAALKKVGIEGLAQAQQKVKDLQTALEALGEAHLLAGTVERLKAEIAEVAAALEEAGANLTPALRAVVENAQVKEQLAEVQQQLDTALVGAAESFGGAMVDAAFGADIAWDKFIKGLLADLTKAIIKALILRAIAASVTGGASEGAAAIGLTILQHGGRVRGGTAGLDSVAALLQPGEIVLPERLSDDFDAIAELARESRARRSGDQGRAVLAPAVQMFNQIVPRRNDAELAELIEDINMAVERRGYRLVSTEVRS